MKVVWCSLMMLCAWCAAAGVEVRTERSRVILENERVRVTYDLAHGTYDAADLHDPLAGIRGAGLRVNAWASSDAGVTQKWESLEIKDGLGAGKTLRVRSEGAGWPALILEITLHESGGAIALRGGIDKLAEKEVRVREIDPLAGTKAFDGIGEKSEWRILNGTSGAGKSLVTDAGALDSPNNIMLTFKAGGRRRSLVLGGLTYHEFAKYASIGTAWTREDRGAVLGRLAPAGARLAGYLDCGARDGGGAAPGAIKLRELTGQPYDLNIGAGAPQSMGNILFDDKAVVLEAAGLDPQKAYLLGFSWWDNDAVRRVETVAVVGDDGKKQVLLERQTLPNYRRDKKMPEMRALAVPRGAYDSGKMKISFEKMKGANAIVSEAWLWEMDKSAGAPQAWGPVAADAASQAPVARGAVPVDLVAADPVGRLVDAPGTWLSEDAFYVDFTTANPFEALEQYGLSVRAAQNARPNIYRHPTICGWYVMMKNYGGGPDINNSAGMVDEMDAVKKAGFLKYSPVAVRLVPDTYSDNNEQGWWDEAHWQQYGHYVAPYETTAKWAGAVRERGGIAETYFQTGFISLDYVKAHPGHFLFNDISTAVRPNGKRNNACSFDYTDPEFVQHVREVWDGLRRGGVRGVMFDYTDTGWHPQGGFEDRHATAAAAYRKIFELAKEGLGPDSYIHERNIAGREFLDMTAGVVDSQRVWGDTDLGSPEMYTRCGLRWYKNRVIYTYDMDAKNLNKTKPQNRDGVRQMLTLCTLTGGRLLLANSFRKLTAEQLHDLSRVFPVHDFPKSSRPLDMLKGGEFPRVYDLEIAPGWHQVAFYNPDAQQEATIGVELSTGSADGGMGLKKEKAYYVYDFWNDRFVGKVSGAGRLEQTLRPGEVRMMAVHEATEAPQFIATDRHVLQGAVDLRGEPNWDAERKTLAGKSDAIGGEPYRVVLATNGRRAVAAQAEGARCSVRMMDSEKGKAGLAELKIEAEKNATIEWTVRFE